MLYSSQADRSKALEKEIEELIERNKILESEHEVIQSFGKKLKEIIPILEEAFTMLPDKEETDNV